MNRALRSSASFLGVAVLVLGVTAGGAWFAWLRPWPFGGPVEESLVKKHFQHGCELLDAKRYDEAIKEFTQTILLDPDGTLGYARRPEYGEAYMERGTQELHNENFVAAVPDLEQAAEFMPSNAKVFSRLGAAWSGQKRWDRAMENYTIAIQIEHDPVDYQARGQAYLNLDKLDNAIADFYQSVKLDPKNVRAYADMRYAYLGYAYMGKKDPESAVQALNKAVQICHGEPNANSRVEFIAHHLRASAYLDLGKTDEAAADLERVFDLAKSDQDRASSHDLFYALSLELAEAKRYADAARWIKKAIDFAPDEAAKNTYREALKTYSTAPPQTRQSRLR
jgi:tetratricopeptide (TPR) repeat protein